MNSASSTTTAPSTNPSSSSSSTSSSTTLPKLGPAWYRAGGGNKGGGFRPSPVVPFNDGVSSSSSNSNSNPNSQKLKGTAPANTTSSSLHPRERNNTASLGVMSPSSSSSMAGGNVNSFSALVDDDDDDQVAAVQHQQTTTDVKSIPNTSTTTATPAASGRTITTADTATSAISSSSSSSSGPRLLFQRNSSSGTATQGRTLAELAAATAPSSATTRTSSYLSSSSSRSTMATATKPLTTSLMTAVTDTTNPSSIRSSEVAIPEGFRRSADDPDKPVIRYTREKLLAMRPSLFTDTCPTVLKHLVGIVILANQALDPVSFDEFDADEIWAAASSIVRGGISRTTSSGSGGITLHAANSSANASTSTTPASALKGTSSTLPPEGVSTASSGNLIIRKGSDVGGRWERGVALPPPGEDHRSSSIRNEAEVSSADDLWDDPLTVATKETIKKGAAADFSSFGTPMADIMEGVPARPTITNATNNIFDLATLSEAALRFEEEIHPEKIKRTDSSSSADAVEVKIRDVNPARPLASAGMTIRSGSGDHVNVFEDFDDQFVPEDEQRQSEVEQPASTTTTITTTTITSVPDAAEEISAKETPVTDETATANDVPTIGLNNSTVESEKSIVPSISSSHTETASSRLMQMIGMDTVEASSPWTSAGLELKPSFSLPRNPWGEPIGNVGVASREAEWKALQEAELQRQRQVEEQAKILEEQKRIALVKLQQQQEEERKRVAVAQQEAAARQAAAAAAQQQLQQQPSQVELVLMERISTILENSWGKADLMAILTALHRDDARVIPLLPNHEALKALLLRHPNRIQLGRDPAYGVDVAALALTNSQFASLQQEQQQEIQRQQQRHHQQQQATAAAEAQARSIYQQLQQRPKVSSTAPWYYADPQGNIQGPFGGDEMRQWLDGGYFKDDLPISQNVQGPFRALSLYFPDWRFAFLPHPAEEQQRIAEEKAQQEREKLERLERERRAEKERLELEEQQRVDFEQRMERERANEILRKEKESGKNVVVDQNASSVQLKMLLGLGGKQQQDSNNTAENRSHTAGSIRPQPMAPKQQHPPEQQSDASSIAEVVSSQPVVAWGGAAQQILVRKKSMSEIQQEEARVAARLAKEREAIGSNSFRSNSSSGGWANVAAAGTSMWTSTGTARPVQPSASAPIQRSASPVKSNVPVASSMQQVRAKQQAQVAAAQKQVLAQKKRNGSSSTSSDDFGAKMSPALENWCKEQLRKITGSDDLTLVSFCTTLKDDAEIHQYLVAYLGSSPQVNSFASEFINRKNGGKRQTGEEWETTGKAKARKGKKTAASSSK